MTLRRRKWAGLVAALIVCFTFPPAQAAEDGGETAPVTYTYRYELKVNRSATDTTPKSFALSVRGTASDGTDAPPLLAGSIALNATNLNFSDGAGAQLSFEAADWLDTIRFDGGSGYETGTPAGTDGKGSYLGFTWSAKFKSDPAAQRGEDGSYFLGTVRTQITRINEQQVTLLPWTQTQTGAEFYEMLSQPDADVEALQELIGSAWRIADKDPYAGYFQGFYVTEDEAGQAATDIGCGWQSLAVLSYAPQRPVLLEAARGTDKYYAELPGAASGTGFATATVKFEGLTFYKSKDLQTPGKLEDGSYTLTLYKQSHLPVKLKGLTVLGDNIFPELLGNSVYLPCGDVAPRIAAGKTAYGDGSIDMADRAALMACIGFVRPETREFVNNLAPHADLDGDGAVTMGDLSILISPRNFGARFIE